MDCCYFHAVMKRQKLKNLQSDHWLLQLGHTLYGASTVVYYGITNNLQITYTQSICHVPENHQTVVLVRVLLTFN